LELFSVKIYLSYQFFSYLDFLLYLAFASYYFSSRLLFLAGQVQQQYRQKQNEGTPLPILWIAEYFTIDEELIRWGRSFRTAGWFTWMVIWQVLL